MAATPQLSVTVPRATGHKAHTTDCSVRGATSSRVFTAVSSTSVMKHEVFLYQQTNTTQILCTYPVRSRYSVDSIALKRTLFSNKILILQF